MNNLDNKETNENKGNAAEELNRALFAGPESFDIKVKNKDRSDAILKKLLKTMLIIILASIVAFGGAFFGVVWVCQTAILGDSEFFQSIIVSNSGVHMNRVDVDYISGEYQPTDSTTLAEKVKKYGVEIKILDYDEELNTYTDGANGSGVIISYDEATGYATIVSNHHVLYGSKAFNVILHNGEKYTGELLHLDEIGDLAIVRIKTDKPVETPVIADSSKLVVGQELIAVGNPLGLGLSVSYGHLSHADRDIGDSGGNYIQADISVNPGNSGGGLFDAQGQLVGIVTAKASGTNVDGIGYAIPSNRMVSSVNDLLKFGYVKGRPAMGVTIVNVTASTWDYFNEGELAGYLTERKFGVYIISSKYYNDIQKGDRIAAINGSRLDTKEQLTNMLVKYKAGDKMRLTLERKLKNDDGSYSYRTFDITIILRERDWADTNQ